MQHNIKTRVGISSLFLLTGIVYISVRILFLSLRLSAWTCTFQYWVRILSFCHWDYQFFNPSELLVSHHFFIDWNSLHFSKNSIVQSLRLSAQTLKVYISVRILSFCHCMTLSAQTFKINWTWSGVLSAILQSHWVVDITVKSETLSCNKVSMIVQAKMEIHSRNFQEVNNWYWNIPKWNQYLKEITDGSALLAIISITSTLLVARCQVRPLIRSRGLAL
jgi:hypothetical protein